ncbi:MAG: hypothetical protein WKF73_08190 [Nocardioidaceae bacterium]
MLRGEVLARWQEFVGTGELLRSLEDRVGRLRDRLWNAARGRPQPAQELTVALESGPRDAHQRARRVRCRASCPGVAVATRRRCSARRGAR